MSLTNKVIWSEGLFLTQHVFQQQSRFFEGLQSYLFSKLSPNFWGVDECELDEVLLNSGKLAISAAKGIFKDGTCFCSPLVDYLPAPLHVSQEHIGQVIYLAMPVKLSGLDSTSLLFDVEQEPVRRQAKALKVLDETDFSADEVEILTASLQLRLLPEKELSGVWQGLPIGKILSIDIDNKVKIDHTSFMQTALNAFSVPLLKSWISAVSDLTRIRANLIRERLLKEGEQVGFSEVFDHCILQILNRYNSHLSHISAQQFIHPEDLYLLFVGYVAELNTYTQLISGEFPPNPYTHGDLFFSFTGLFNTLLSQLNQIIVKNVMPFDLFDRGQGYRQSSVSNLPDGFKLILVVNAAMPSDMLSKRFLAQVKVGAFESLSDLIKAHLPGARLQTLQQISRQIPHAPNAVFFEILQQGSFWDQIKKTGSLGLHVAGDFPSLNIMVWGVQDR